MHRSNLGFHGVFLWIASLLLTLEILEHWRSINIWILLGRLLWLWWLSLWRWILVFPRKIGVVPPCGVVTLVGVALVVVGSHRIDLIRLPNHTFQHREAGAYICRMLRTITNDAYILNRHRFGALELECLELLVQQCVHFSFQGILGPQR